MIRLAHFPADNDNVLSIWREYIDQTRTDLGFQQNDREFVKFPSGYEPPDGCVLLADCQGKIAGCIAMRRFNESICEMKRLYVRPGSRGSGLGRRLVDELIGHARVAGYLEMRLDVLAEFAHARRLYLEFGFAPADPITNNPVQGTAFLGLMLN
ncbi:MAG: GNAT family N-acetyltransferase [Sphingomonadales bacterium]|nr:MAG: GNAT family N-acetyltransferase [Sphingomonadales bacterium]